METINIEISKEQAAELMDFFRKRADVLTDELIRIEAELERIHGTIKKINAAVSVEETAVAEVVKPVEPVNVLTPKVKRGPRGPYKNKVGRPRKITNVEEEEAMAPKVVRPKAEYSNKSPFGIAASAPF